MDCNQKYKAVKFSDLGRLNNLYFTPVSFTGSLHIAHRTQLGTSHTLDPHEYRSTLHTAPTRCLAPLPPPPNSKRSSHAHAHTRPRPLSEKSCAHRSLYGRAPRPAVPPILVGSLAATAAAGPLFHIGHGMPRPPASKRGAYLRCRGAPTSDAAQHLPQMPTQMPPSRSSK